MRTTLTVVALIICTLLGAGAAHAQISYSDFRPASTLQLRGAAAYDANRLRLTPSRLNTVGAAWHKNRQYVSDGFITTFQFQISSPGGESDGVANGGDGIAFVIQNSDQGDGAIGLGGGQIGYGTITRSVVVEFDMWNNGFSVNGDPSHNHVSVQTNGTGRNSADHRYSRGQTSIIPNMGDGAVHTVRIEYLENWLAIYLDDCQNPALRVPIDIAKTLELEDGHAWFGLTAGTASSWQNHDILSWRSSSLGLLQSGTSNLCEGDSLVLTVPTADGEVIWSNGSRARSIVVREPGEYKVAVLEKLGCRDLYYDRLMKVTVSPRPDPKVTVTNGRRLCPGDTAYLDAGPGYSTYRWSNGARTRRIAVTEEGSYSVQVTNEFGCSRSSAPVDIIVYKTVTPTILPNRSLVLCTGDSVTLDAGENYLFYRWSTGALTRTITVQQPGEYWVSGVDKNGCTSTSKPVQVTRGIQLHPFIVPGGPTQICEGEGVRLDAGADYSGYRWSTGETTRTILVTAPGQYTVSVTSAGGCEGTSKPVTVVVYPRPLPTITASGPLVVCKGVGVTLDAGAGYARYRWSTGDTTRTIIVEKGGQYSVMVTTEHNCTGSATIDVDEKEAPKPVLQPSGAIRLCAGDSLTLDAGDGYASYLWSNGERGSRIVVSDTGTYFVTVANADGCFGTSEPVVVTVHERPVPMVTPEGPVNFCTGETLMLRATPGYAAYRWSTGETTQNIVVRTLGDYSVVVTDSNGCTGASSVVTVEVGEVASPRIILNGPPMICPGDSLILEAPAGYREYIWSNGERTRIIAVRTPGRYHLEVRLGEECRGFSDTVDIGVYPAPALPSISENAGTLVATEGAAYQWYLDDAPLAGATERMQISAGYGVYTVAVTNENGCTAISPPYSYFNAVSMVALPTVEGAPGALITVPLVLMQSQNLEEDGLKRFRATVRFDRSLLIPGSVVSCCGPVAAVAASAGGTDWDDYLLTFEGERAAGISSGSLADIQFTLAMGDTNVAPLGLVSFEWLEGRAAIATADGMIRFNGLCGEGGERLVSASGDIALKSVRPNPTSGRVVVEYALAEDGPTGLYLIDQLGRRVETLVAGEKTHGAYQAAFDAGTLPAGMYFLVLETPTERLSTVVQVVK